ncbi:hypothetical protein P9139_16375 [Curtobacterium flaccumfaciens]|nr:hypothetical protein P9139_16375 [Curtobacterium flaccumfaciens]
MDSLVHWARDVRVDGFRFDLMAALARDADHVFDPAHPLLERIRSHPDLQDVLVVAEPWDVGPDGWRTGSFGARTSEWNDGFRNTVRQFWLTDIAEERRHGSPATGIGALAGALTGSRPLFDTARGPLAGVNFVTAHDGFTLLDLVSYDGKHNEANGEENRDGSNDNRSFNHGVEGDTADRGVRAARDGRCGTSLPRSCSPPGCRCSRPATNAAAPSTATTTRTWCPRTSPRRLVGRRGRRGDDRGGRRARPAPRGTSRAAPDALRCRGTGDPGASRMSWYGPDGHPMTVEGWDQPIHRALQYYVESTPEHEPFDRVLVVVHGSGRTRTSPSPAARTCSGTASPGRARSTGTTSGSGPPGRSSRPTAPASTSSRSPDGGPAASRALRPRLVRETPPSARDAAKCARRRQVRETPPDPAVCRRLPGVSRVGRCIDDAPRALARTAQRPGGTGRRRHAPPGRLLHRSTARPVLHRPRLPENAEPLAG